MSTDITERHRAEEALRQANETLEERVVERTAELRLAKEEAESSSRLRSEFLAKMSHELRTPLNGILGFTGTLLMRLPGPLTSDQEQQLKTVQRSAQHLLSLINDLLDVAKIEAGKVELTLEPVICQHIIDEVVTTLRPLAEGKGLQLTVQVPSTAVVVHADRRAMGQILLNLTNNAIKFTEQGSVQLELCQRRDGTRRWVELSVVDTGAGIRPDDQAKLFQVFVQADGSTQRRTEGTGLGLYLCRQLAELLGGQLTLHSKEGVGSRFTLHLQQDREDIDA